MLTTKKKQKGIIHTLWMDGKKCFTALFCESSEEVAEEAAQNFLARRKEMEEGYKALSDTLRSTAQASLSLQKKVIPDY